jgi:hypothetical protein
MLTLRFTVTTPTTRRDLTVDRAALQALMQRYLAEEAQGWWPARYDVELALTVRLPHDLPSAVDLGWVHESDSPPAS